ncbi:hypothetical protein Pmani_011861 [Petrolisthes manimaculis]|uniref:Chitin-binding type-2 domain-containing protein n=1 Tax=Petrolisthes manimaculis TaxID=1843537 RepID=A0AAE1PYV4_9EUCA|nr:hypothetical protein Pmani_011861 [Petrolisthes manimaculis]
MEARVLLWLLVASAAIYLGKCVECPGEYKTCTGSGYQVWNEETGEAVICLGMGTQPECPASPIDKDGNPLTLSSTTTTSITTTTTPTTTTTTPTTTTTTPTTTTTTPTTTTTTPTTTTTTPTPTTTTTTTPCNPSPATCVNKEANVLYPHPECNCQKYYVCRYPVLGGSDLILYQYTCFGNEVFNPNTGTCTSPGTYICP